MQLLQQFETRQEIQQIHTSETRTLSLIICLDPKYDFNPKIDRADGRITGFTTETGKDLENGFERAHRAEDCILDAFFLKEGFLLFCCIHK